MRVYVAARHARREEMFDVVRPLLEDQGHVVTSRWLTSARPPDRKEAIIDVEDIDNSEVVVVMTDPTGNVAAGGGRWFEAGYGFGTGKRVIFVGDPEIVFCHHPGVECYPTLDQAIRAIRHNVL